MRAQAELEFHVEAVRMLINRLLPLLLLPRLLLGAGFWLARRSSELDCRPSYREIGVSMLFGVALDCSSLASVTGERFGGHWCVLARPAPYRRRALGPFAPLAAPPSSFRPIERPGRRAASIVNSAAPDFGHGVGSSSSLSCSGSRSCSCSWSATLDNCRLARNSGGRDLSPDCARASWTCGQPISGGQVSKANSIGPAEVSGPVCRPLGQTAAPKLKVEAAIRERQTGGENRPRASWPPSGRQMLAMPAAHRLAILFLSSRSPLARLRAQRSAGLSAEGAKADSEVGPTVGFVGASAQLEAAALLCKGWPTWSVGAQIGSDIAHCNVCKLGPQSESGLLLSFFPSFLPGAARQESGSKNLHFGRQLAESGASGALSGARGTWRQVDRKRAPPPPAATMGGR